MHRHTEMEKSVTDGHTLLLNILPVPSPFCVEASRTHTLAFSQGLPEPSPRLCLPAKGIS